MIIVHGKSDRVSSSNIIIQSGEFSYRLDVEWAKWPESLKGVHVLGGGCDENDNLYVATENPMYPIVLFRPDGEIDRTFGEGYFSKAHNIFVTNYGTLLCADAGEDAHVVRELTVDGEHVKDYGILHQPGNVFYDSKYIETLLKTGCEPLHPNWRVNPEFYAALETIKGIGRPFTRPCAMVASPSGELFAADGYGNNSVHKFSADGELLKTWGESGDDPGQFLLPHDIWIDRLNRVWVADRENSRAQVFTTDGELIAIVQDNMYLVASIWSDEDYIYLGELNGGITILNMDIEIVAQIGFHHSQLHVHGLCGDSKGNLFLQTNTFNCDFNNLLKLTRL